MRIAAFQKVSLIDYPGKICSIVFIKGCNFRCPWCFNSELANLHKYDTNNTNDICEIGKFIDIHDLFSYLEKRKGLIEGVCITGGEPCLQEDLLEFLGKIKEMGFLVKIDTNGSNPEVLKSLLASPGVTTPGQLVDYVAMDIKAPLKFNFQFPIFNFQVNFKYQISKYEKAIGIKIDLRKIEESIEIIKNSNIDYEFRTTVVPKLLNKKDIIEIAKQIKGAKRYVLQGFVNNKKMIDNRYKDIQPYSKEVLEKMANEVREFVRECEVRY